MGRGAAPAGLKLERAAPASLCAATAGASGSAEHAVENVFKATAAYAAGTAAGAEAIAFEPAAGRGAAARVAAGKALKARLALGVDFAAIELLALVLVADDLVRRIHLRTRRGSLRLVLVVVGVMFLGELAIGALDCRSAAAPRPPQTLLASPHPPPLLPR